MKNVVLVHGAFVDAAGWDGVYKILKNEGYADENRLPFCISRIRLVITEAGNHPKVSGLVYVAAFAPGKGESVSALIANPPPGAPVPPILPLRDGYLFLDRTKFPAAFAADVSAEKAAFMADSQVAWGLGAVSGPITEPAWRKKLSWYLVTTEDRMIPPAAQRAMFKRAGSTVVEVNGSHAIYRLPTRRRCGADRTGGQGRHHRPPRSSRIDLPSKRRPCGSHTLEL